MHYIQYHGVNEESVKATELAIADIYNGKAGGSVYDKIYIPPADSNRYDGVGTLFFVIDTYDPRLGVNGEHPDDELQPETEQTSVSQQQVADEKVQGK